MPPSKLDKYLKILEVLVDRPQTLRKISCKARAEPRALRAQLHFLVSNGVVEKRTLASNQVTYAVTERGLSVFKTLRALKYLEKLRDSMPIVEEAREIAALLSKRPRMWKED